MKRIFILITGILFCVSANAQQAFTNNGNLQIHTGASVSGPGNFTNNSSGVLVNNGSFYVKGNISNDQSSMAAGTGTLYLNGTTAQTVNGTVVFKTFNLVTNNAAGISLNNNLSISSVHTYTAGIITTSATPNYLIYEAGSSYAGDADSKHVKGWVKKMGSTDFIFPVGNGSYERQLALTNLSASSEFNVKHNNGPTPDSMSLYNPLVLVNTSEYWTINKISGSAAKVEMNWDNSKISLSAMMLGSSASKFRAAYYDGTFWREIGGVASGNIATSGSLTSNSVTAFNTNFTIGSISIVLPLKIISFTASHVNDYTKINWTIGNELNVDRYELERSDDGINFYTISVQSPHNNNGTEFYSHDDRKVLKGTAFYRLKLTGLSNEIIYSATVTVSENTISKDLYVVTNPVEASIEIYAGATVEGIYNYTITNTGGQVMQSGILDMKYAGIHSIQLRTVFSPGAYILLVKNEINTLQKTIIKK